MGIAERNVEGGELAAESVLEISDVLGTPAEQARAFIVLAEAAEAADLQCDVGVADR